ncbi:MAG: HAD family hydrolase [Vulcanimicrobiota bacterium]
MIKAVIFDFDGVILESAQIKTEAFRELFSRRCPEHLDAIVAYHLDNVGISRYVKFRHIYEAILHLPYTEDVEKLLGDEFAEIVLDRVLEAPFVDGALEFLREKSLQYDCFVASGTPEEELLLIVERRGLARFFKEVHGTPRKKVDIIEGILACHQYERHEVVFIGDGESDLRAATEADVPFIARLSSECCEALRMHCCRIDNLTALSDTLVALSCGHRSAVFTRNRFA